MTRLLSLHLISLVFSGIHCNNDNNDGTAVEEIDGKYSSVLKGPISTPEDFFTLEKGWDTFPKLVRLLTDAEWREGRNKALKTITPSTDLLRPRIFDDDFLNAIVPDPPKVSNIHMHHIFPPHIIRPLQRAIVKKMIDYIENDPMKKFKKIVKRKVRIGTVAVGLGLGIKELKELKSHPLTAQYKVTGLVDLSANKKSKDGYDEHGQYGDDYKNKRHKRSVTFTVNDYKLRASLRTPSWPFQEYNERIFNKWNGFPSHSGHIEPLHHKYLDRSSHDLDPDIFDLVPDVHGLVGTRTKIIHSGPDLEQPIVIGGQLIKLADSLIPSIRFRIPFLEYLKKSFFEKSKPRVVYVKQPPKVKYVGVPYKDEDEFYPMPEPSPIHINIPITVPESAILPEPTSAYPTRRQMSHFNPQQGSGNYELLTNLKSPYRNTLPSAHREHNHKPTQSNQHRHSQMFDQAADIEMSLSR